jgi:hypothetical protein
MGVAVLAAGTKGTCSEDTGVPVEPAVSSQAEPVAVTSERVEHALARRHRN